MGLRTRVASIRTLIFSFPHPLARALTRSEWGRPLGGTSARRPAPIIIAVHRSEQGARLGCQVKSSIGWLGHKKQYSVRHRFVEANRKKTKTRSRGGFTPANSNWGSTTARPECFLHPHCDLVCMLVLKDVKLFPTNLANRPEKRNIMSKNSINRAEHHHEAD